MLNSWLSNISFSSYYKRCSPISCTYEYMSRNGIFFVITTIIGIFGGLDFGLEMFIFIVLRCIEKMTNNLSFRQIKNALKRIFIISNEQQMIHRLHFGFLSVILYGVFIFSAYESKSITVQSDKPSLSAYQQLSASYSDTLQCSCSHISIPYQSFLIIKPRFHQICSSEFVSEDWINYIYKRDGLVYQYLSTDYRSSSTGQFVLLASLCKLSKETINITLSQLLLSDFISSQLLSPKLLDEQIETIITQFRLTTSNSFLNILNLIREITGSNMVMSGWFTNWAYSDKNIIRHRWTVHTIPVVYNGCHCGSSWKCIQPSQGMMAGCYALEALLQTTLQCFYDQNCIDANHTFIKLNISTLETSQFRLNSTIQSILNNLMIEEYKTNLSYEKYFDQCLPSLCTYSYIKNHNAIQAAISLISLYGGLVIITHCLAVIISKICYRQSNRIDPEVIEMT